MLKVELHTHINRDPEDSTTIAHDAYKLIDRAAELNYDVLAITCHNFMYLDSEAERYASQKGIILISGIEKTIEGKHVLLYNISSEIAENINSFERLREVKSKTPEMLVVAPHPWHKDKSCLGDITLKHLDLFDAWEFSWFYTLGINPNRKTVFLAQKNHKPVIGNSDVHELKYLGKTYSLIDSKKDISSIINAIKKGKITVETSRLSWVQFLLILTHILNCKFKRKFMGRKGSLH